MWIMMAICQAIFSSHRITFSHPGKSDPAKKTETREGWVKESVPKVEDLGRMVLDLHTSILRPFELIEPCLENRCG